METTNEPDVARLVIEHSDDVIRDTVRSLMAVKRYTIARLAALLSMNEETLRRKLNSWGSQRAFSGGEVVRLAQVFDVPFADMASGRFLPIGVDRAAAGPTSGGYLPLRLAQRLQVVRTDQAA